MKDYIIIALLFLVSILSYTLLNYYDKNKLDICTIKLNNAKSYISGECIR